MTNRQKTSNSFEASLLLRSARTTALPGVLGRVTPGYALSALAPAAPSRIALQRRFELTQAASNPMFQVFGDGEY